VLAERRTKRLVTGGPRGLAAQAAALIAQHGLDDTTYIYDLGNTTRLFRAWRAALPRVQPFYAVKVWHHQWLLPKLTSAPDSASLTETCLVSATTWCYSMLMSAAAHLIPAQC
jgi:diaminopimelate decarboxylase